MSKTLQLQHVIDPLCERDVELARLRAAGKLKLAALAERLWSALPRGAAR